MVISASRRTDIPAFYTEWFMNRVREGVFTSINPFNRTQQKVVSLDPKDVDAIVFWTKYPAPLIKHLTTLDDLGFRYYFQFTLNDYPDIFEPKVPPLNERLDGFRRLSDMIGKHKVIWRYDPIILSNRTPLEYHIEKFDFLAGQLASYANRVMISFLDLYGKVLPKLKRLEESQDVRVEDLMNEKKRDELFALMKNVSNVAKRHGLEVYSCAEKIDLDPFSVNHGACIDQNLINKIFDLSLEAPKDKSQRTDCLCAESIDMGTYNTCRFNCVYCYANHNANASEQNWRRHIPTSPTLLAKPC
jgi:DNA repair photolyase